MTTSIESPVAGADIPTQVTAREVEEVPSTLLDLANRQWHRGTGRAIASAGDLVSGTASGTRVRSALPVQVLSVVELRIRAAAETSVRGAEAHPHVAAAISAALAAVGAGDAEVQVSSLRSDGPHVDGTDRVFTETTAAVRGVCAALKVDLPAREVSRIASSVLPDGAVTSLALPGLQVVDAAGAPLADHEWWPQYAVVRIVLTSGPKVELDHGDVADVLALLDVARSTASAAAFASAVTSAAERLEGHPAVPAIREALSILADKPVQPLGWVLSTTGPIGALLYPADDLAGRNASYDAARTLTLLLGEGVKASVSISPRCPQA